MAPASHIANGDRPIWTSTSVSGEVRFIGRGLRLLREPEPKPAGKAVYDVQAIAGYLQPVGRLEEGRRRLVVWVRPADEPQVLPIRPEHLYRQQQAIGDVDTPRAVHGHRLGPGEGAFRIAGLADGHEELPRERILLDHVVQHV